MVVLQPKTCEKWMPLSECESDSIKRRVYLTLKVIVRILFAHRFFFFASCKSLCDPGMILFIF